MSSTTSRMAESEHRHAEANANAVVVKRVAVIARGLFFIWMGTAFLAHVGWGVGLLGVGVIVLGAQATRKYFRFPVERFWLVLGIVLAIWGVWELLNVHLGERPMPHSVVPILFIVFGVVVVVAGLLRRPRH